MVAGATAQPRQFGMILPVKCSLQPATFR